MRSTLAALALLLASGVSAQSLTEASPAVQAALAHLRAEAPAMGVASGDVADLALSSAHRDARTGLSYVYLQQRIGGVDVADRIVSVAVDARGEVIHAAGDLASGTAAAFKGLALSPEAAVARVAALVGARTPALAVTKAGGGAQQKTTFGAFAGLEVTAKLVYAGAPEQGLRLAWEVQLPTRAADHLWLVRVDAATGEELMRHDLVIHDTFGAHGAAPEASGEAAPVSLAPVATGAARGQGGRRFVGPGAFVAAQAAGYQVYPLPVAAPIYAATTPPADGRSLVSGVEDALASPYGWHDTDGASGAEFTTTRGNNAHAYVDRDDDEAPDAAYPSPDGGAALAFTFPLDLTQDPTTYTDAAATQLFYLSNVIHDVLYRYGFTEAAGNFQANNYGRGGASGDAVDAEVQSGADICNELNPCRNNANFMTPSDGSRPRMQMYVGTNPNPDVDGSFDSHVVVHEYGHGISIRLVGGPSAVACLRNAEQMGEGWSDWYGNMFTMRAGDTRATRRPVGNYLFGQSTAGGGIRNAPYSTDFGVNDYTYGRTRSGLSVPHGVGFVWATILWEATWDMIDAHGFDADLYNASGTAGNQIMMALVTEGLKLTPCNPGFVDGRDAILAADAALYPDPAAPGRGLHYATLWEAFARRGLGASASQGSTSSNSDNTEAFDLPLPPPAASVAPGSVSRSLASGEAESVALTVSNTAAAGSAQLNVTASLQNLSQPASLAKAPAFAAPEAKGDRSADGAGYAAKASGGPDAFGYVFQDSDEAGGPAVDFQDISATGTAISFSGVDDGSASVTLPFAFPFYGTDRTAALVSTNGYLTFGTDGTDYDNDPIPNANQPNALIAPYWDDLHQRSGTAHTATLADGRFVVQWSNWGRYSPSSGESHTFQVLLSPDGTIEFQYGTITTGVAASHTVGIENDDASAGLEVAANTAYAVSNKAVRITPAIAWAGVSPSTLSIAPEASGALTLGLDATELPAGTYTADLVLETNDPNATSLTVPVTLIVDGATATATIDGEAGWRLLSAAAPGMTVADLAGMNRVSGIPGYDAASGAPNVLTGFDGLTLSAPAGGSTPLTSGEGFWWYLYDVNFSDGPTNHSYALPFTLATDRAPATADVDVALHADNSRVNMLGNPFGQSLDLSGAGAWTGKNNLLTPVFAVYDSGTNSYAFSTTAPVVSAWQGFYAYGKTAGTLTIPASARTTGGTLMKADDRVFLALELSEAPEAAEAAGRAQPLADRGAVLYFSEDASAGEDAWDLAKLAAPGGARVSLAFGASAASGAAELRGHEGRPLTEAFEVPLHVEAAGSGEALTLAWPTLDRLPAGWALELRDLETGTVVDLRAQESYAFTVAPAAAQARTSAPGAGESAFAKTERPPRFVLAVTPALVTTTTPEAPGVLALAAPVPNPARGAARVAFQLAEAGEATLTVYDVQGREVARLLDGRLTAGAHEATWQTGALAAGVYVVRLATADQVLTRRAVVVR